MIPLRPRERAGREGLLIFALSMESKRFRAPAGARVPSLCWPTPPQDRRRTAKSARRAEDRMPGVKRSNQQKWPDSTHRDYKQGGFEGWGPTSACAIHGTAILRRVRELRKKSCGAWLLRAGARCFFRGPWAAVRRGREGRAAGIARDGGAFSTGQDARPKSPDPPHGLAGQDARQAPPRGVVSSWLLLLWTSKGEVTRAPEGHTKLL